MLQDWIVMIWLAEWYMNSNSFFPSCEFLGSLSGRVAQVTPTPPPAKKASRLLQPWLQCQAKMLIESHILFPYHYRWGRILYSAMNRQWLAWKRLAFLFWLSSWVKATYLISLAGTNMKRLWKRMVFPYLPKAKKVKFLVFGKLGVPRFWRESRVGCCNRERYLKMVYIWGLGF